MQVTFWQKSRFWVLLLLVFLITISSHPKIIQMSLAVGRENGTILSKYIILLYGGLFVMCFNLKSMFANKFVRVSWFFFALVAIFAIFTMAFYGTRLMLADLRAIAICIVAVMVGWQLNLDERKLKAVLLLYAFCTLYVSLMQVLTNIGGFVIEDVNATDNKNSLGVLLSTAVLIFFYMYFNLSAKSIFKIVFLGSGIFVLILLLTIRARAATLSSLLMIMFVFYERFKGKQFFLYLLLFIGILVIAYLSLPVVKEYVYNSFFQNHEDDITSGRTQRNQAALAIISNNVLTGNLNLHANIGWVHNYPLLKVFDFGLVYSFPLLLIYLYYLINSVVNTVKANSTCLYNIGYFCLIIPFMISFAEPTFPFGPGTVTVFNFIVFGIAIRNSSNQRVFET